MFEITRTILYKSKKNGATEFFIIHFKSTVNVQGCRKRVGWGALASPVFGLS
jgi:hypothetical protein